jgi:hypothetical protein
MNNETELREEILGCLKGGIQTRDLLANVSSTGMSRLIDLIQQREEAAYERGFHQQEEFYKAAEHDGVEKGYRKGVQALQEALRDTGQWDKEEEIYWIALQAVDNEAEKLLSTKNG